MTLGEQIRARPGMWIGSTGPHGVFHLVLEVVGNVYDQFLQGEATSVRIDIDRARVRVTDDGPGLPFGTTTPNGRPWVEHHLLEPHDTASADGHAPHVHPHTRGVGLAVVNALTKRLDIESTHEGTRWRQSFSRGEMSGPAEELGPSDVRGTTVEYEADEAVFDDPNVDIERVASHMNTDAHLYPGLRFEVNGQRFHHPTGVAALLGGDEAASFDIRSERFGLQLAYATKEEERETTWRSWVNGAPMCEGGTHHDGAAAAFATAGIEPATVVMHLVMNEPEFAGPTKGKLVTPWVRDEVERQLSAAIAAER